MELSKKACFWAVGNKNCTYKYTVMTKKAGPKLRDPVSWLPSAAGVISRNLRPIFFTIISSQNYLSFALSSWTIPPIKLFVSDLGSPAA